MWFVQQNSRNSMKAIFFKFQRFSTAAFDTDTFQHAILDQNEGQIILYPVI